ncbi:MAG: ribonuclease R [Patescibacteria group bacterium]
MSKQIIEGEIRLSSKGVGYVDLGPTTNRRGGPAAEIDPTRLNTALHGDVVRVEVDPLISESVRTGRVVAIIERRKMEFVGVLEQENGFRFVRPDDKKMYVDILIDADKLGVARQGDKVLAKITTWTDSKKDPIGEILEVIGPAGQHDTEMRAIVLERGFKTGFPAEVEAEAKQIKASAEADLKAELAHRRDFRSTPTFTIDPADAKDFDDAISIANVGTNEWEVGVHIADVAHYLRPGTALDREAQNRATSIYLVDRTIPMLPEILSDDLCSLNPNEDKLAFSAVFTLNTEGEIKSNWFGRTIIHSHRRFSYEEAEHVLATVQGDYAVELKTLNQLAYRLREKKFAAGAIAFEKTEIKFRLDAAGRPIEVIKKERGDSHRLVEDFMLLANRRVAEHVSAIIKDAKYKFVYRIHDAPDAERLAELADFLHRLGYRLEVKDGTIASRLVNQFLLSVRGQPEEALINTALMRSMAKAIYSTENIGHYGLAFEHYTHFTSPIRRYPDVMVHRLLDYYLRGETPPADLLKNYLRLVVHSSIREQEAADAERDSVKYKQVEFLQAHIGQTFAATISGITKWGIYVEEKETLADGLVRLAELGDDYYIFDEKNYAVVGERSGRRYRLGDPVQVKLIAADLALRQLDFTMV